MKKALVVGRTLIDDKSGGARGTLSDILAIKEIYGKNIKVVLPLEACQRLEKEFQVETIPVPKRNSIQKLLGAITLTSMDRLRPFIDNNMEEIFSDVDIVFFTGSVLGRYAEISGINSIYPLSYSIETTKRPTTEIQMLSFR